MSLKFIIWFLISTCLCKTTRKPKRRKFDYCTTVCGVNHYVCIFKPCVMIAERCGDRYKMMPLTKEEKETVINYHNKLRNDVAEKKNTEFGPVKRMNIISYSEELSFIAQCWANLCFQFGIESKCRATSLFGDVGQNIYITHMSEFYLNVSVVEAMDFWAGKQTLLQKEFVEHLFYIDLKGKEYAQMIWQETTYIGCGRVKFMMVDPAIALVCNYGIGLIKGLSIYEPGKSVCKGKYPQYPSLCGALDDESTFNPPFQMGVEQPVSSKSTHIYLQLSFLPILFIIFNM